MSLRDGKQELEERNGLTGTEALPYFRGDYSGTAGPNGANQEIMCGTKSNRMKDLKWLTVFDRKALSKLTAVAGSNLNHSA
jgi:hypothetical protein